MYEYEKFKTSLLEMVKNRSKHQGWVGFMSRFIVESGFENAKITTVTNDLNLITKVGLEFLYSDESINILVDGVPAVIVSLTGAIHEGTIMALWESRQGRELPKDCVIDLAVAGILSNAVVGDDEILAYLYARCCNPATDDYEEKKSILQGSIRRFVETEVAKTLYSALSKTGTTVLFPCENKIQGATKAYEKESNQDNPDIQKLVAIITDPDNPYRFPETFIRDKGAYTAIQRAENNRSWICRAHFKGTKKFLIFNDEAKTRVDFVDDDKLTENIMTVMKDVYRN